MFAPSFSPLHCIALHDWSAPDAIGATWPAPDHVEFRCTSHAHCCDDADPGGQSDFTAPVAVGRY